MSRRLVLISWVVLSCALAHCKEPPRSTNKEHLPRTPSYGYQRIESYQRTEPIHITQEGQRWAERTLARLTVQEKVGQLFMLRAPREFYNVANPQYAAVRGRMRHFQGGA